MSKAAPAEKKVEAPHLEYSVEDGKVIRTYEQDEPTHVANYDGKTLALLPAHRALRKEIVTVFNEKGLAYEAIVIEGDTKKAAKAGESIPPMPKKDMRFGDKTPALVEWYRKYKPEEYRARYGVRGMGKVTKTRNEIDGDGKLVKVPYEVEAEIADRKTHVTELPAAANADSSEYNDA
jgi:hypothetical protein